MDPLGLAGDVLDDKYAVDTAVGEGGFATVYRAMHLVLKRPVALKVFHAAAQFTEKEREALVSGFVQEAAVLADLSERSAAICQARDVGTLVTKKGDRLPYMVLEWLEGETLEALLDHEQGKQVPPRSMDKAVRWLEPVAEALALAHGKGIAHRDVKPANIFILGKEKEGVIKLLDFGIAKVVQDSHKTFSKTNAVASSFTPAYGSPEQFVREHGSTGPWSDVFSFALVLVEVVTGKPPLSGQTLVQLGFAACNPEKRPTPRTLGARVSDSVEAVFKKALSVMPGDRFQTVGEMWAALVQATGVERRSGFADVAAYMPQKPLDVDLPDLDVPAPAPSKPGQQKGGDTSGSYGAVDFSWDQSADLNVPDLLPDVRSKPTPSSPAPQIPPDRSSGSLPPIQSGSGIELAGPSSRRSGPAPAPAPPDPIHSMTLTIAFLGAAGAFALILVALLHKHRGWHILDVAPQIADGTSVTMAAVSASVAVVLCILSGTLAVLREPRIWGLLISAIGFLGMAIGLIVVTVSAPPVGAEGPPAEGGFVVPMGVPLVPIGIALALVNAAVRRWRDDEEKGAAAGLAVAAGLCLFAAVELAFGARV